MENKRLPHKWGIRSVALVAVLWAFVGLIASSLARAEDTAWSELKLDGVKPLPDDGSLCRDWRPQGPLALRLFEDLRRSLPIMIQKEDTGTDMEERHERLLEAVERAGASPAPGETREVSLFPEIRNTPEGYAVDLAPARGEGAVQLLARSDLRGGYTGSLRFADGYRTSTHVSLSDGLNLFNDLELDLAAHQFENGLTFVVSPRESTRFSYTRDTGQAVVSMGGELGVGVRTRSLFPLQWRLGAGTDVVLTPRDGSNLVPTVNTEIKVDF